MRRGLLERWSKARACARDRRGAVALEFAIMVLPFLVAIMSCFELLFVFTVSATLDTATAQISRQIETGQLQLNGGATEATLQTALCNDVGWLGNVCQNNMYIDIRTFQSFGGITPPSPVSNGVFNSNNLDFDLGNPGDVVLVTVYFQWPLIAPTLDNLFQPLNNGTTLVISSTAFRNEPYS